MSPRVSTLCLPNMVIRGSGNLGVTHTLCLWISHRESSWEAEGCLLTLSRHIPAVPFCLIMSQVHEEDRVEKPGSLSKRGSNTMNHKEERWCPRDLWRNVAQDCFIILPTERPFSILRSPSMYLIYSTRVWHSNQGAKQTLNYYPYSRRREIYYPSAVFVVHWSCW